MSRNGQQAENKLKKKSKGHTDYTEGMDTNDTHDNHCKGIQYKKQELLQLQRTIEASKQMVYGVFGNVITILEEYERRELASYKMECNMPKSEIYIRDQSHKNFEDIQSNVETQLLLFETQTKACPPEALAEVHEELKKQTLAWSAVREEMGIKEIQQTDYYMSKLYEILAKGATMHKPVSNQEVTEEVMRDSVQAMMQGEHDRENLDSEFKNDAQKEATAPKTRSSEMYKEGASRISRAHGNDDLDFYLNKDVDKCEGHGPDNLK